MEEELPVITFECFDQRTFSIQGSKFIGFLTSVTQDPPKSPYSPGNATPFWTPGTITAFFQQVCNEREKPPKKLIHLAAPPVVLGSGREPPFVIQRCAACGEVLLNTRGWHYSEKDLGGVQTWAVGDLIEIRYEHPRSVVKLQGLAKAFFTAEKSCARYVRD